MLILLIEGHDITLCSKTIDTTAANGTMICLNQSATLALQCKNFCTQQKFYLSDDINKCLLGMDFLFDNYAVIDAKNRVLQKNDKVIPLIAEPHLCGENFYCAEEISLAPQTETSISGTKLPIKWCQFWGIQFIPTVRKTALEILYSLPRRKRWHCDFESFQ